MNKQDDIYPSLTLVVWATHSQTNSKSWHCECDLVDEGGDSIHTFEVEDILNGADIDDQLSKARKKSKAPLQIAIVLPPEMTSIKRDTFTRNHLKNSAAIASVRVEPLLADNINNIHTSVEVGKDGVAYIAYFGAANGYKDKIKTLIASFDKPFVKQLALLPFQALGYKSLSDSQFMRLSDSNIVCEDGIYFTLPSSLISDSDDRIAEIGADKSRKEQMQIALGELVSLIQSGKQHPLDMARGEFSAQYAVSSKLSMWKVGVFFVAAMCCISVGSFLKTAAATNFDQAKQISNESNALFLSLAPSQGRVIDLKRQINAILRLHQSAAPPVGKENAYGILGSLEKIGAHYLVTSSIQQIALHNKQLSVDWMADSQATLIGIESALTKSGLHATLEQSSKAAGGVTGHFVIEGVHL